MGLTATGTTLEYNGIQLRDCQTLKFMETPVNDATGTDLSHLRVAIRVLGYFTAQQMPGNFGTHPQFPPAASAFDPQQSSSSIYQHLHTLLLDKRKRVRYIFNDVPADTIGQAFANDPLIVFDVTGAPEALVDDTSANQEIQTIHDVTGGPEPMDLSVTQITGNNCWRVEFEVSFTTQPRCYKDAAGDPVDIAKLLEADPALTLNDLFAAGEINSVGYTDSPHKALGVLSNRWSSVDAINADRYLTRTTNGNVELANPGWNPHDYRYLTLPPLHPGMKRASMNFTASETGRSLKYSIIDEEVTLAAPGNTTSVKLDHSENLNLVESASSKFQTRCEVKGDRTTSRSEMLQVAAEMLDAKLLLTQLLIPDALNFQIMITNVEVTDHQGTDQDNTVSMSMSGKTTIKGVDGGRLKKFNPAANGGVGEWEPVDHLAFAGARSAIRISGTGIPGNVLQHYNNQRSKGNRDLRDANGLVVGFETPSPEGPISGLSALSAALQERCTVNMGMGPAVRKQLEGTVANPSSANRASRVDALQNSLPAADNSNYRPADIFPAASLITITEAEVLAEDLRYSADHRSAIYDEFSITSAYPMDAMTFAMPVADTTKSFTTAAPTIPNTAIIALGVPQSKRVITIIARRLGSMPELPALNPVVEERLPNGDVDAIAYFERATPVYDNPIPTPDGSGAKLYSASLVAHYNYDRVPTMHRMGIAAWDDNANKTDAQTGGTAALDLYRFTTGLIYNSDWNLTS